MENKELFDFEPAFVNVEFIDESTSRNVESFDFTDKEINIEIIDVEEL